MVIECFLVKLYMLFPEDVVRVVIAIVVCTHRQRDLLLSSSPEASDQHHIMTLSTVRCLAAFLEHLFVELWLVLQWIASDEARTHRQNVNEAIFEMQTSLQNFMHESARVDHLHAPGMNPAFDTLYQAYPSASRPSPSDHGQSDLDNTRSDFLDLGKAHDLRILLSNFTPLSVTDDEFINRTAFYLPELWRQNYSHDSSSARLRNFLSTADALASSLYAPTTYSPSPIQRSEDQVSESASSDESDTIININSPSASRKSFSSESDSGSSSSSSSYRKRRRSEDDYVSFHGSDEDTDSDTSQSELASFKRVRREVPRRGDVTSRSETRRRQIPAPSPRSFRPRCSHNGKVDAHNDLGSEDQCSHTTRDQGDCSDTQSVIPTMQQDPDDPPPPCETWLAKSKRLTWLQSLFKCFSWQR